MPDSTQRADLAAMLAWYRDMGIDAALADAPVNWLEKGGLAPGGNFRLGGAKPAEAIAPAAARAVFQQPRRDGAVSTPPVRPAARAPLSPVVQPARQFPTAAPDAATMAAREIARSAATLDALHQALAGFQGCGLKATAKNLCFYRGSPNASLMIIGEAPGRDEDLEGKPFVGRAGQLLDKMLAAINLGEADVHITNIVYWRPPGNRTPTPQEAQICRPFLDRQMELVAPKVVMTLGGPATAGVLGVEGGIMKSRGRWREIEIAARSVRAMPTLHPAYLLRTPAAKKLTWRDLLAVRAALAE
jgi:uracil-DNA glycosylase family 4